MKKHFLSLLLFCIGAAAFAAADPDGLVAAYDFADAQDGFVRDYGPNCNVGYIRTLSGNPADAITKDANGKQVFKGDGKGNYVTIPDHKALRQSSSFTVEIVCEIDEFPKGGNHALVAFESTRARIWVHPGGTIGMDSTPQSKPDYFGTSKAKVKLNEKLHIFAFIEGDEIGMIVNGKRYINHSYRGSIRQSKGDISIGGHPFRCNRYFKGKIHTVRFYNRRLTDQEMAAPVEKFRPSAIAKSGLFLPGEKVSFLAMDNMKAPAAVQIKENTAVWETADGKIVRSFAVRDLSSRRKLLDQMIKQKKYPKLHLDMLKNYLNNRLVTQYDDYLRLVKKQDKQLFRYGSRLEKMANREFDEKLLMGKNGVPPISTFMPPVTTPDFLEFLYEKSKDFYVRNFIIHLNHAHNRIPDTNQLKFLQSKGMKISTSGSIVTNKVKRDWAVKNPDLEEVAYSFSDAVAKNSNPLELSVKDPHAHLKFDAYRYWQLRDETTKQDVEPKTGWTFDAKKYLVTVKNPVPGHRYAVYYLAKHVKGLNISLPGPAQTAAYLADWEKFCKMYKNQISFHHMDGCFHYLTGKRMKWWEFWGYSSCNGNPAAQKAFEEYSGIKFRPAMLFPSLDGMAINYAPTPELKKWMEFNQKLVKDFIKKVADIGRQNGVIYQFYWGDKHLGFEPDLDAFEVTGVGSLARPLQDAVDVRSMTEQNGKTLTSGRLEWLFAYMVTDTTSPEKILENWYRNRRGELFRIRDLHYFAEFPSIYSYSNAALADIYVRTFQRVHREFLLMYKYLHGKKIFTHDLNVYVMTEWGKQYSWRPWRDPFLRHFTDVPVNMKWISHAEVAEKGVPADCAVLLNYGNAGSSWVGTNGWQDKRLTENIRKFVRNGGGFLGFGESGCYQDKNQLADVMGFEYTKGRNGGKLQLTENGKGSFLAPGMPKTFFGYPFSCRRNIKADKDFTLLASFDGKTAIRPLAGEKAYGKGRSIYVSFQSNDPEYDDLVKRAIFRAAGREKDLFRLYSTNPVVMPYAYGTENIFVLNNDGKKRQTTTLKMDLKLFAGSPAKVRVKNIIDNKVIGTYTAADFAKGVEFTIDGNCAEYFKLEKEQ